LLRFIKTVSFTTVLAAAFKYPLLIPESSLNLERSRGRGSASGDVVRARAKASFPMRYSDREQKRQKQQKINELRHQLRYANDYRERDYIAMQIDAIRRHS
jgi:hypothetical protein